MDTDYGESYFVAEYATSNIAEEGSVAKHFDYSRIDPTGVRGKIVHILRKIDFSVCNLDPHSPQLTKNISEAIRGVITLTYSWDSPVYAFVIEDYWKKVRCVYSSYISTSHISKTGLTITVHDPFLDGSDLKLVEKTPPKEEDGPPAKKRKRD